MSALLNYNTNVHPNIQHHTHTYLPPNFYCTQCPNYYCEAAKNIGAELLDFSTDAFNATVFASSNGYTKLHFTLLTTHHTTLRNTTLRNTTPHYTTLTTRWYSDLLDDSEFLRLATDAGGLLTTHYTLHTHPHTHAGTLTH